MLSVELNFYNIVVENVVEYTHCHQGGEYMLLVGSKIRVTKGVHEGIPGTVTSSLTIPMSQIWPLVEGKGMPEPECSIVLYSVELDDGTGVTLPLDCIEFIDT